MNSLLYDEITHDILAAAGYRQPVPETRYHKHREYLAYGLPAAELWRIMKAYRLRIMAESLDDRLDLASGLLARHIGELGHGGIYVLARSTRELSPGHFPYLDQRLEDFRSWSHVDYFCGEVMHSLLIRFPAETLAQLEFWSQAANRFKRRTSVVVFARKSGALSQFTDDCLVQCDKLVWDPEDIVQKGVGWALKEHMKVEPERIIDYVKKLRRMGVPSTITLYAIGNLKGEARQEILAVKKEKT